VLVISPLRLACAGCLCGTALLLGCGGGGEGGDTQAANPPASKLRERVLLSGNVPRVRATDLAAPIAAYRRYAAAELAAMSTAIDELGAAVDAGDLAASRRAWVAADARYEAIDAAYGAFGELDARIDGEPGGLEGGPRSPEFTGLHRIELALWGHRSTAEAAPHVERLAADVESLRQEMPRIEIEPLEYVLRCHEVLEGTLDLQLSGRASPWSATALVALRSNLRGTETVLGSLRPLIRRRSPLALTRIEASLGELARAIGELETPAGGLPRWDALPAAQSTEIAGLTAAAAEQLAYVPEVVDPRPPLPLKSALGTVEQG
jgi:iron uptake system EfeUOB component EfeO/EfeM